MTLEEAVASGRPFRHKGSTDSCWFWPTAKWAGEYRYAANPDSGPYIYVDDISIPAGIDPAGFVLLEQGE